MPVTSRILKASAHDGRRIPGAVYEADLRVRETIAAAQADAARIRAEADAERARVLAEAREQGAREGWARAAAVIARAGSERDRLLAAAEGETVALALAVARKVLGRELSESSRAALVDLAAHALAEARDRREVTLRVSPGDADAMRTAEGQLAGLLARGALRIRQDPSLSPGDVVVETEAGRVDARVETQLAALARALEEAVP